ncbi:MAG: hypothetical protein INR71_07950, partial [Terriglobus roseus]|nr:hypothetical protein [Terriglobus roseus]
GAGEEDREWVLADPDDFEEGLCGESVTVTVDGEAVRRIEKSGGTVVDRDGMRAVVAMARERWKELAGILKQSKG